MLVAPQRNRLGKGSIVEVSLVIFVFFARLSQTFLFVGDFEDIVGYIGDNCIF